MGSLPRNVWALSLTSFLRDVASEMLVHLLPLFLANSLGVRTIVIGLIEGTSETIASLTKIYSGWLSDRMGRRKPLAAGGYGLSALATPLLLVAQGWPLVFVYRALDRLGKGIRTSPRDALIADSVPQDRRGAAFGMHRAADTAGAFVGLLIAIVVVWNVQEGALLLSAETFRWVVALAIVPAVLATVVVVVAVTDVVRPSSDRTPRLSLSGLGQPMRRFVLVMVLFTLGNSSDAFIILRAQSVGTSVVMILVMIAAFNLTYTLLAAPAGALSDRVDRRRIIVVGWLVYAAVYLGFALAGSALSFWLLYPFYGAYYALTEGVAKAYVADLSPADRRGTSYGVYNGVIGLTALPASVIAGLLWQGVGSWSGIGPGAPFVFGAIMSLIAAALLWYWVK
jgi:MFS family permease